MTEEQPRPDGSGQASVAPWWKGHLNFIGLFIGTHGLAVFLVVYYTVYLYPKAERERGEWIEQITRVRQLLEPETRALTSAQADAVLSIAKTAFIQQLQAEIQLLERFSDRGMSWSESSIKPIFDSWRPFFGLGAP
jgi:hypothetical protein